MIYQNKIFVLGETEKAQNLAKTLELPLERDSLTQEGLYLAYYDDQLFLCSKEGQSEIKASIDFMSSKSEFRRQRIGIKSEPLLRAIGCSLKNTIRVLDATAGFARDAFLMANYNCDVTLLEESPIVAALLQDGLHRAHKQSDILDVVKHMHLKNANAVEFLEATDALFDAIYLDPMFPPRTKAAKVKKEMQLLHMLLGAVDESQNEILLEVACSKAQKRVVVKRPKNAPFLAEEKPSYSINTKAMRFDVYQRM